MVSNLFASMSFAVCALIFLLLILIMYINKKKFKGFESGIFAFLLILSIILTFLEMIYIFFMYKEPNLSNISSITEISCRTYALGTLIWMLSFIYYILCLGIKNMDDQKKKKRLRKILLFTILIVLVVTYFISSFVPHLSELSYKPSKSGFLSFGGPAVAFSYAIGILLVIILFVSCSLKRFNFTKEQKKPIYFSLIFFYNNNYILKYRIRF